LTEADQICINFRFASKLTITFVRMMPLGSDAVKHNQRKMERPNVDFSN